MLKLNTIYTWDTIVKEYPDLWVIITDIKEHSGEIKSCKLLEVCTADERAACVQRYKNLEIKFRCTRTTFSAPNVGILA